MQYKNFYIPPKPRNFMAYLNKVMLMGNMGKDAEVRVTTQGRKKASFSLATTRRFRDANSHEMRDQVEWHNIVAWGPMAERIEKLQLRKGTALYVEGRITSRDYEDPQGIKRKITEIFMDNFEFLQPKGQGGPGGYSQGDAAPAYSGGYQNSYQAEVGYEAPPLPPQTSYAPPASVPDDDDMPF
jgi:single-strand DNA-binding protein